MGSMSRLTDTAWPSLRQRTHSKTSVGLALIEIQHASELISKGQFQTRLTTHRTDEIDERTTT